MSAEREYWAEVEAQYQSTAQERDALLVKLREFRDANVSDEAWQLGRTSGYAAGMEAAAKVCEERERTHERNSKSLDNYTQAILARHQEEDRHCATAIRAAAKDTGGPK